MSTSYTYEPFGKATSTGAASSNSFQHTGRENDGTGLDYLRARYYGPGLPRFVSEDPIGLGGGDVNLYAYVYNQPLAFVDRLGLCGFSFGGILNVVRGRCGSWDFVNFNNIWNAARIGGALSSCLEGARVGAIAGPETAIIGCLTVAIAFDLSAEQARHRIENAAG